MSIVYQNPCNLLTDFSSINGSGVSIEAGKGYIGNALKIDFSPLGYQLQSARISFAQVINRFQVYFNIPAATTLSATVDGTFVAIYPDSQYNTNPAILQLRIQGSGTGFTLKIVDPSNSFAGNFSNGTIWLKDMPNRVLIERTATQWKVYINKDLTPILLYLPTIQPPVNFAHVSLGCDYNNAAGAISGPVYFDQILGIVNNTVITPKDQLDDVWDGIKMRYITVEGAVVRPIDLVGGQTVPDVVSEGIVYGTLHAAQRNDQETFNRIDNWTRANLDRRICTAANTVSNLPSNALNLMSFLYKPNLAKPIIDANWAGDADIERAVSLSWAHARWGSSQFTVDTPQELLQPNYFARAKAVIDDLRNFAFGYSAVTDAYYQLNDSLQLGYNSVCIAPDYNYVGAYRDIFSRIDPTNAGFWDKCVKGAYDINDKCASYVFANATPAQSSSVGLTPNWCQFDLTTAQVTGVGTYGDSNWGYNSFRAISRMIDDWNWARDQRAVISIQKPKPFLTSEWNIKGKIQAEYKHDGTPIETYDSKLFYFVYYFILTVNDPTNAVGQAILSTKLASGYQYAGNGSYFHAIGYFDDMWHSRFEAQRQNLWVNYGQPINNLLM